MSEGGRCRDCGREIRYVAILDATTHVCDPRADLDEDAPPPDAVTSDPAKRFGRYVLGSKLGAGGMGEVWKAWDTRFERWVAVKLLKKEQGAQDLARFHREAGTSAALSHPNIAPVYDVGQERGRSYIAMQYVPGRTLVKFPRDDRKLTVRLIRDAARAVGVAHAQGIVHRDIKPSNLMVARRTDGWQHVYVLDFGLARRMAQGDTVTATGVILGTPSYMSPEQVRGDDVDARSDVFSFGVTLYELLCGHLPFQGKTVIDIVQAIAKEKPRRLRAADSSIDLELDSIVHTCLEKDLARRYKDAIALADDLDHWLEGRPPALVPKPARRPRPGVNRLAPVPRQSNRALAIAIIIMITALLVFATWWIVR